MNIAPPHAVNGPSGVPLKGRRRLKTLLFLLPVLATGISPLPAAWTLYQNFESLSVGYDLANGSDPNENFSVATQDISNPAARYGGYTVAVDPTNAGNKLLKLDAVGYALSGQFVNASTGVANPVVNLQTGTLFYRFYRASAGTPDVNFGGADLGTLTPNANNAGNYQSQLNVSGGTSIFRPRNSGGTVDTGVNWTAGSWFGIFQVINTQTNTTRFYYQGEFDAAPILLTGAGGSPSDMGFRNGGSRGSTDIGYFLAVNGLPAGGTNNVFYLDDIYVDATNSNLVAPVPISAVPEPATVGLALSVLCGAIIIARRRRLHSH